MSKTRTGPETHDDDEAIRDYATLSYPEYLRLHEVMRSKCPVAHSDELGGFYVLSDYQKLREVSKDWKTFTSAQSVFLPAQDARFPPLDMDPPEHTFWRDLIKDAFSVTAVREFAPTIRKDVTRLIDRFAQEGSCDAVRELAEPLPVLTICGLIGMHDRGDEVRRLTQEFIQAGSVGGAAITPVLGEFASLIGEERAARRSDPRDDPSFTELVQTELHEGQLLIFLIALMIAGHETTISAMASLVFELAGMPPDSRQGLVEDPKRVAAAIEEAIRLHPPVFRFSRVATKDVDMMGTEIPAGSRVVLNYAGVNRDPDVFDDPSAFRVDRGSNPHVGFGFGPHRCIGAPLARIELKIAIEELVRRLPDYALAGKPEEVEYKMSGAGLCGLDSLPIRFTPEERVGKSS